VDWSKDNCNRQNKKSTLADIKEAQKYNKGGFTHPIVEFVPASEETLHMCQSNINKEASASIRHNSLAHLRDKFRSVAGEEGEREWHISGRGLYVLV
jgi:hypothetical protein